MNSKIKKIALGDNCLNDIKITSNISVNEKLRALFDFAQFFTSDIKLASNNDVIDLKLETKKKPPVKFVKYLCNQYQVSASIIYGNIEHEKFGKVDFNALGEKCFDETYDLIEYLYKYYNDSFWGLMQDLTYSLGNKDEIDIYISRDYVSPEDKEKIKLLISSEK